MKIKNLLFGAAFSIAVIGAFAFKAPKPNLAFNAADPSDCKTLVADCNGGTIPCTVGGPQLKYSNGTTCAALAYIH